MDTTILFPFASYWWLYAGFTVFVLGMLALDLGVFHREAHEVKFKEAVGWSIFWIVLALIFNVLFWWYAGWRLPQIPVETIAAAGYTDAADAANKLSLQFLTGYVVEKSLSVDNIFVIVMIFTYFAIPAKYQHRVLFYGIIGALIFRAIFIALGAWLMAFKLVVLIAGGFLILTGVKMLFAPEKPLEPEKNPVIKLLRKMIAITPDYHGQKFFVRLSGVLHATPLFVALVFVEITDVIFAIDSVPAIFALTKEPLIVFTSNVFAILGLRALYFVLAGMVDKFYLLKYGLGIVLVFVGLKMVWLNEHFGGKFPIEWSLSIIGGLIGASIGFSLLFPRKSDHETPAQTG
jgi:tellurite resistance protein TerC